jgi:RNA polymerase sigma factor (sigma-70 family)
MNDVRAGAELAEIEAVYRTRLGELRRVATAITGSREAGCDAVQEAFALAVHRRAQFRGEGRLEAWLWRIVVHRARDLAARASTRSAAGLEDAVNRVQAEDPPPRSELHALLSGLPERQRHALFLRYYADLDYATIAEALEISSGTVGATLAQAKDNLRRLMTGVRQ